MKEIFIRWHRKPHTERSKVVAIFLGGFIFVVGISSLIVVLSSFIDSYLHLPKFNLPHNIFFAIFLIITGLFLVGWTGWSQFKIGKGSPLPLVPTQKLVITGPYKYCRNPMTLGVIIYYLGIAFLQKSLSALLLVGLIFVLYAIYIKLVEEKELEARFGETYKNYKKNTPFIIPKFWRKKIKKQLK